jgi:LysM repeat protein
VNRKIAARLAAPAAFLAGITVAVLLVRAGLHGDDEAATTAARTTVVATTRPTTTTSRETTPEREFVRVERGDTLDQIALEQDTTVERLLVLNPGIDPNSLRVGQRVRVR